MGNMGGGQISTMNMKYDHTQMKVLDTKINNTGNSVVYYGDYCHMPNFNTKEIVIRMHSNIL
jgi:hypothetical protein